jgi:hypothetical protein
MEMIDVGRVLWARRFWLVLGFVIAAMLGVAITYKVSPGLPPKLGTKTIVVGEATTQVLIDTPTSQIADTNSQSAPNIYNQANLLADVMATAPVQHAIAAQLHIPLSALTVVPPPSSIVMPIRATPLALASEKSAAANTWKLAIAVDPSLPIVAFDAVAPTPQAAQQLASDAVTVLRNQVAATAEAQHIASAHRLVVNVIDPPTSRALVTGPRKLYVVALTVVAFFAFAFALVMIEGRRRRRAMRGENHRDWHPGDDHSPSPEAPRTAVLPGASSFTERDVHGTSSSTTTTSRTAGEPARVVSDTSGNGSANGSRDLAQAVRRSLRRSLQPRPRPQRRGSDPDQDAVGANE